MCVQGFLILCIKAPYFTTPAPFLLVLGIKLFFKCGISCVFQKPLNHVVSYAGTVSLAQRRKTPRPFPSLATRLILLQFISTIGQLPALIYFYIWSRCRRQYEDRKAVIFPFHFSPTIKDSSCCLLSAPSFCFISHPGHPICPHSSSSPHNQSPTCLLWWPLRLGQRCRWACCFPACIPIAPQRAGWPGAANKLCIQTVDATNGAVQWSNSRDEKLRLCWILSEREGGPPALL